jgi:acetolactate synthase-1/2/3 large subunit
MKTGADLLVEGLARRGVSHLFGMPGSHSTTVYDAIARAGSIRTILVRNEQAAAFAADGYARVTGRPGVVCTTAGPGATNALSGVAECWADSVPVLLLAGQVNAATLDREVGNYHEIDLERIFQPATKWCGTVRCVEEIPAFVARAFQAMTCGRPRPAAIFLPQDLMRAPCPVIPGLPDSSEPSPAAVPADATARAAEILAAAARPIILAGGGALWSGSAAAIEELARRLGAPVVTTLNAKGILDERHPLSLGHARSTRARHVLPHADAMLAVGCRFTEVMTDWRRMSVPRNLIQIDLDPDQIGVNYPVVLGIVADAKATLEAVLAALPAARKSDGWGTLWDEARTARTARPEWLIDTLRDVLPGDVPVITDACEIGYRMHTDWPAYGPRRFFYPSNYIALGWAFPAAVGAAVAGENAPVVSVSGDGGFVMTAQELATAVRYRLGVIALVHNDSTYGAIKNIQERVHAGRFLDVELNNPDFLELAAAFGAMGRRARGPEELRAAVLEALDRGGPWVIEVPDRWRFLRDLATPFQKA